MFERFINKIHSQNDNQLPCPQLKYCHERMFIGDARLRYTQGKGLSGTLVPTVRQSVSQTLGYAIVHNEKQIHKSNPISLSIELVWFTLLSLCQAQLECINHSYVHIVTNRYNLNLNQKYSNYEKDSRQLQFSLDIATEGGLTIRRQCATVGQTNVHFR